MQGTPYLKVLPKCCIEFLENKFEIIVGIWLGHLNLIHQHAFWEEKQRCLFYHNLTLQQNNLREGLYGKNSPILCHHTPGVVKILFLLRFFHPAPNGETGIDESVWSFLRKVMACLDQTMLVLIAKHHRLISRSA